MKKTIAALALVLVMLAMLPATAFASHGSGKSKSSCPGVWCQQTDCTIAGKHRCHSESHTSCKSTKTTASHHSGKNHRNHH